MNINWLTNLPKRSAIMPPLKPPNIPPTANIETAKEYILRVVLSGRSLLYLNLYTSFIKVSIFCKKTKKKKENK